VPNQLPGRTHAAYFENQNTNPDNEPTVFSPIKLISPFNTLTIEEFHPGMFFRTKPYGVNRSPSDNKLPFTSFLSFIVLNSNNLKITPSFQTQLRRKGFP
jgi:hypothetical protein